MDITYVLAFPALMTALVIIGALYQRFMLPRFRKGILTLEFLFPVTIFLLVIFPEPLRKLAELWPNY